MSLTPQRHPSQVDGTVHGVGVPYPTLLGAPPKGTARGGALVSAGGPGGMHRTSILSPCVATPLAFLAEAPYSSGLLPPRRVS